MADCVWDDGDGADVKCLVCKRPRMAAIRNVARMCAGARHGITDPQFASPLPLGDYIESGLSAIGITKERVAAWLGSCGGCNDRQARLNQLGSWIARKARGEAVESEVDAAISPPK